MALKHQVIRLYSILLACSTNGERRGVYSVLVGKPEVRSSLGDPGIDERIILGWIFKK
jgi:hypothetical protein